MVEDTVVVGYVVDKVVKSMVVAELHKYIYRASTVK